MSAGSRVIFEDTERMREVWLFTGLQSSVVCEKGSVATSRVLPCPRVLSCPCCPCFGREEIAVYQNAKLIGGLWMSALAKEHPFVYFTTV